jgi:4'-phosphopantetheinyl transferase
LAATGLLRTFEACWTAGRNHGGQGGVVVGVATFEAWRPWLAEASGLLDDDQRTRAARLRRQRDAEARVLAYALHRLCLAAATGLAPREVPLWRDARGCPRVGDDRWRTSLAHAEAAVAIAVGDRGAVGVDIEHAGRAAEMEAIADDVWHPLERAQAQGHARAARGHALLEAWVRKEAFLKAAGVGIVAPMSGFALPEGATRAVAHGSASGEELQTTLVDVLPGHVVALSRAPGLPVRALHLAPG